MEKHEFGKILQNERTKQGITQAQLSEMTGFTIRAITYWENGHREMSVQNANKVFGALGLKVKVSVEKLQEQEVS